MKESKDNLTLRKNQSIIKKLLIMIQTNLNLTMKGDKTGAATFRNQWV